MNALRESMIRHPRRRRRPIWLIVLMVAVGTVALFGIGFGLSLLIRGDNEPVADGTVAGSAAAVPQPCITTMITPAEVLPRTSKITINVYNATKRSGLATSTADVLHTRGFLIKEVGNDPEEQKVTGVAEIRYGPKGEAGAQLLGFYLPGAELVPIDRKKKLVDVVIGKQFTEVLGDAKVAAAMASPSPSASGAGCSSSLASAPATVAPTAAAASAAPAPSMSPEAMVSPSAG